MDKSQALECHQMIEDEYFEKKVSFLKIRQFISSLLVWIFLLINILITGWAILYHLFPWDVEKPFWYQTKYPVLFNDLLKDFIVVIIVNLILILIYSQTKAKYTNKELNNLYVCFNNELGVIEEIDKRVNKIFKTHNNDEKIIIIKEQENINQDEINKIHQDIEKEKGNYLRDC
ncbi:MAG: hypothetical protein LBR40_00045 [Bacilli bacterium]|jgi:hypothetical protein|nr:hypothetical protein [Bacilli bacterium]